MGIERVQFKADAEFWPLAVAAVREFARSVDLPSTALHGLVWLVPGGSMASVARGAWAEAHHGAAHIPPRIVPLAEWLGVPLSSETPVHVELFNALRANAWARQSFGSQSSLLWRLARAIADLCDELSWAAAESTADFDARLTASLQRHFQFKAARAMLPQAQLVLRLWRARNLADDGPARALRELAAHADGATSPLVYLIDPVGARDDALASWEEGFLERYARRSPVLTIQADGRPVVAERPLLRAAWPELAGGGVETPIAARGDALGAAGALSLPLKIIESASLEEEANVVAQQVLDWTRAGVGSIALVALDRLTARRVRALLERAQILVRDETGWKLSTTSASAAVMRWFELVAHRLYWRDLLDWLRSPFTLVERPNKLREVAALERAIRVSGVVQGSDSIRRALAALERTGSHSDTAGAREIVALLESQIEAARRTAPTFNAQAKTLRRTLEALGMQAGLANDIVGSAVLRELASLESEISGLGGRATLADYRTLVADRFEEVSFVDRTVDSPITLVSLTGSCLRRFDAAVLIGADARHLPASPLNRLFVSDAVRAELGLETSERARQRQAKALAILLASTPTIVATWRNQIGDEANALSPLLERLRVVAKRAVREPLVHSAQREQFAIEAVVSARPAPSAPQLLPLRLTASRAQSLVNCAYQFYARQLLGLAEFDEVVELAGKRDFGISIHEVLRRFHSEWGAAAFDTLDRAQLAQSLILHARSVFEPQFARTPGLLAFQRRFEGLVEDYVEWLQEHAAKGWRWLAAEEKKSQHITLDDGRRIELTGRVDRIDVRSSPAGDAMLLIDYKARPADRLRNGLKAPGEDVQLPFYGMLLAQPVEAAYVSFDRTRESQQGVTEVAPPQAFAWLVEATTTRLQADLQRIANGASLPAIGLESTCEYCEMRGLCRRDYWSASADAESIDAP